MKNQFFLAALILLTSMEGLAADCNLTYFGQSHFHNPSTSFPEVKELSKTINVILKKSYDTLDKIDEATLGLVSAIATGGHPISHLKPEQWDKVFISGNLIYADMPFSGTALRGAKLTFSEKNNSRTLRTGSYGEFSESFSKLVPYWRLRLFSGPIINVGTKSVPTLNVPITVRAVSSICSAETKIHEVPLEPILFVLSKVE